MDSCDSENFKGEPFDLLRYFAQMKPLLVFIFAAILLAP